MGFLDKIFSSNKKKSSKKISENLKEIGELNKCPYCKKVLEKIPTRKSKCPFCSNYIYSRTRPLDRQKVLVTEDQRDEIENQWSQYYETKEKAELMENPEFVSAKRDLTKQFGKEPEINDVKWRIFNQKIIEYASKKQWGLYRNNKVEMASLLQKENKFEQELNILFEVCYLDINGCKNLSGGFSKEKMDECGIKEFDSGSAYSIAPGVISPIEDLIIELNLSEKQTKEMFCSTNKRMKPSKNMPISEEKAWEKLLKEINIRKENRHKINEFNAEDIDAVLSEIREVVKKKNHDTLSSIIYKFKNEYKTKTKIVANSEKIKKVIEELLYSSESTSGLGFSLLLFFTKKDKILFESLVKDYIKHNKTYLEKSPNDNIIGELGKIDPSWIDFTIPSMIKALKHDPEWNTRRFVAFNLGHIGSKYPELVKEAIPIMINYIKNPIVISNGKTLKVETKDMTITMDLSAESMGVQWLKDAYIDSLGMIAKGNKMLIEPYKSLFEKLSKKDESEYSQKKAQKVLGLLR